MSAPFCHWCGHDIRPNEHCAIVQCKACPSIYFCAHWGECSEWVTAILDGGRTFGEVVRLLCHRRKVNGL